MPQVFIAVTAPMPPALEARARFEAARQSISRAELVRLAVAEYLDRQPQAHATGAGQQSGVKR